MNNVSIIPSVKVLNALRNSGYNNYTAIADIVDNSLDAGAKKISVIIEKNLESIKICDNGSGMDYETLNEAIKLGSETSKDYETLGFYGTGLNSASISLGRKLTVKTKAKDAKFYIGLFDLDEIEKTRKWEAIIYEGTDGEYQNFVSLTGSDEGTIIEISKLDRISNKNITVFKDILLKKFGLFFKYFIDNGIKILINDELVKALDPMHRNEIFSERKSELNQSFEYNGKTYIFNIYRLDKSCTNLLRQSGYGRNIANAGIYIYRNYRLVGSALDLGIVKKSGDGYSSGIRIELFVDGSDDYLFNSTFMKMISEKESSEINQGFVDKCKDVLGKFIESIKTEEKNERQAEEVDDETKRSIEDIDRSINSNKWVDRIKKNTQKQNDEPPIEREKSEHDERDDPQRKNRWFKTELVRRGEFGKVFDLVFNNGSYIIQLNIDHVYWIEFLSKASRNTQEAIIKLFASMVIAHSNLEHEDKEEILDNFYGKLSEELNKLIKY